MDVHVHPHLFIDRIAVLKENDRETKRFIGIPYKKAYLESLGAHFIFDKDFIEVDKGLFFTGEVPRQTNFEKLDPRLFSEIDGKTTQDLFLDDQSLILDTDKGIVLILGCAHAGMINIINHVIHKTGKQKFYAIVGGTHLDFLTPEQFGRIHQISQEDGDWEDRRLPLYRTESGIQTSPGIRGAILLWMRGKRSGGLVR